jgi:hypothetical protein
VLQWRVALMSYSLLLVSGTVALMAPGTVWMVLLPRKLQV